VSSGQSSGAFATRRKVITGGALTAVERLTAQLGQLIVFIAAARILGPAEFGVFALVSACAILLLRFAEFGWAQYIMSWSGDARVPRQVLLIAMLSGAVVAALGAMVGWSLQGFGFDQNISLLVMLFSLWVLLATTSSAQKGIMIWQDKLKSSAMSEILGEVTALAVALTALLNGFGVLSLVFSRLAFQSVHLLVSFSATRMTPLPGLRGQHLRDMLTFSGQLFTSRMIVNIRLYAATFIIGGFLGPAAVGYYRAAERLVGAVAEIVSVPTEVLAWSLFRQTRDAHGGRLDGFQARANLFFRSLLALALPVFIWLALIGPDLISTLLGPEWLPALPVVALLALSRALMLPGVATEAILSLAGQIRRLIPFTILFLVLTISLTLIGVQFGLLAVAWSQVTVSCVVLSATIWMQHRYGQIDWRIILRQSARLSLPIIFGTLVMKYTLQAGPVPDMTPIVRMIVVTLVTLICYVGCLTVVEPDLRRRALALIRSKSTKPGAV
jgi:O-antigen/teichoic acid export membrane protein